MPMTVPMQRGGSKSLPAEIKTSGHNPIMRLRASSPGYPMRRLRGLGDDGDFTPIDVPPPDLSPISIPNSLPDLSVLGSEIPVSLVGSLPTSYSGPTILSPSASTPTPPAGYQWATMLNQSGQTLAKVLAISQGGSSVQLPNGAQLVYGSPASSVAGAGAGLFTGPTALGGLSLGTLGLLAGGLLLISMLGKK